MLAASITSAAHWQWLPCRLQACCSPPRPAIVAATGSCGNPADTDFLQTACNRTQSASVALSGAAIDAFFIPLLQDAVSAATLPADPPAPATVVSSVKNQISDTPIVIRRVMPSPVHELREKYEVEVLLWPGADIDRGGADL